MCQIIDKFPRVVDRNLRDNRTPQQNTNGNQFLRKEQKSKFSTAASQNNCSSMHPLNYIRENGETMDMEEQMPELVDDSENEVSSTRESQQSQPLRIFWTSFQFLLLQFLMSLLNYVSQNKFYIFK